MRRAPCDAEGAMAPFRSKPIFLSRWVWSEKHFYGNRLLREARAVIHITTVRCTL